MITVIFLALALFVGYLSAVVLSMAGTFAVSSAFQNFVIKNSRVRRRFKFAEEAIWLLGAVAGGYVTTMVAGQYHPLLAALALCATLIGVLWMNIFEMRQRGVPHQIVMSGVTVAGVIVGFALRTK